MQCQTCREAISARMDGEVEPVPAERTDRHLAQCAACRAWQARATEVTRAVRVRGVVDVPDLTARVLADAPVLVSTRRWWPRLALGVVALAQLSLGLAQILGTSTAGHAGHEGGALAGHLFNESTAWNLAVGVGLFWAAWWPRAAAGLIPVVAAFVLVLLGFSIHDLITGAAPATRIAGHGVLLAGLVLLIAVHRAHRGPTPDHGSALPEPASARGAGGGADDPEPDAGDPGLRPVSRHDAA